MRESFFHASSPAATRSAIGGRPAAAPEASHALRVLRLAAAERFAELKGICTLKKDIAWKYAS